MKSKDREDFFKTINAFKGKFDKNEQEKIDALAQIFASDKFEDAFNNLIDEETLKTQNEDEVYKEIADCYLELLSLLNINDFSSFCFVDYENNRRVLIDEKEYDFDSLFCHDNSIASGKLCEMDCLLSDLDEPNQELVLKEIEKIVNS